MSTTFTPIASLLGGMLIGVSASLLLLFHGRVAGVSGIVGGLLTGPRGERSWRMLFLAGLLAGGALLAWLAPSALDTRTDRSAWVVPIAGLLVGVGSALGNGCTSGHGVCGISRLSPRSLAATATFMGTGLLTAAAIRLLGGI